MLTEFLHAIEEMANNSANPTITRVDGIDREVLVSHGGETAWKEVPPPLRSHVVCGVDDLLEAAALWGSKGVLWHGDNEAVLVVDDGDRRDCVTLPIEYSAPFGTLESLDRELDQKQLVRLLKHDLSGCVDADLLSAVRRIEFNRRNDGHRSIDHGGESLGNSVESKVNNADKIPEYVTATFPVYQTPGLRIKSTIRMSLDILVDSQSFRLEPLPDELTIAVQNTQAALHKMLEESGLKVFYGKP